MVLFAFVLQVQEAIELSAETLEVFRMWELVHL